MKKNIALLLLLVSALAFGSEKRLKVLHLSLHLGCINDFAEVGNELGLDLTSWYIHRSHVEFEGHEAGNNIYNITHARAEGVWNRHKDYFNQFDVVITSDTAPLSRIFLQNGWKKPLIIWVCNRFNYADFERQDGHFPDGEYYDLFRKATQMKNVKIISYTPYEYHYTAAKGIHIGQRTIKPVGSLEQEVPANFKSAIPSHIKKEETAFVYPRLSDGQLRYIQQKCAEAGIKTYSGAYNGPEDLKGLKGTIYFPYQWSNLALFENMQRGMVHFIPSEKFIRENYRTPIRYVTLDKFHLCEWYAPEHRDLLVYFDSWSDLKHKIATTDYVAMSKKIKAFAQQHRATMLGRWQQVFDELTVLI